MYTPTPSRAFPPLVQPSSFQPASSGNSEILQSHAGKVGVARKRSYLEVSDPSKQIKHCRINKEKLVNFLPTYVEKYLTDPEFKLETFIKENNIDSESIQLYVKEKSEPSELAFKIIFEEAVQSSRDANEFETAPIFAVKKKRDNGETYNQMNADHLLNCELGFHIHNHEIECKKATRPKAPKRCGFQQRFCKKHGIPANTLRSYFSNGEYKRLGLLKVEEFLNQDWAYPVAVSGEKDQACVQESSIQKTPPLSSGDALIGSLNNEKSSHGMQHMGHIADLFLKAGEINQEILKR